MSKGLPQQFSSEMMSYFDKHYNCSTLIMIKILHSFVQHLAFTCLLLHYPE